MMKKHYFNGDWQVEHGNTILSGGAPFSECVELPDTYTIQMYDSYGDGWNGNILMIGDIEYTLDSGSEGMTNVGCETEEEEICEGTTIFSDGSGGWPDEITWIIYNCDGEVITEGVVPTEQCVELPDTYTIEMYDSWGDGWNGNILMIGDIEYTLDSGSEGMTNVGCEAEEEIVEEEEEEIVEEEVCEGTTVFSDGSGGWPYEISWTISNCEGEVIAEGIVPTDQCVELPDTYTIQMYDSYGDGWNGNILMIGDMEYTLESGSEGMTNVGCEAEEEIVEEEVCEGTTVSCDNGDWQSEVEWSIIDCDGNTILSGGAPFSECVELPDTYTIQMYDSYGDGWNGNILMIGDIEYTLDSGSEGMTKKK